MENELLKELEALIERFRLAKPQERGERARYYAITITELEKAAALFQVKCVPEIATNVA